MHTVVRFLVVTLAVLALNALLVAHHSVAVNYDNSKQITISGVLTEIRWLNPHSRFRVEVTTEAGSTEAWLVEMGSYNAMVRATPPWETDRLVIGESITITGSSGRPRQAGEVVRSMFLRTASLQDGTRFPVRGRAGDN